MPTSNFENLEFENDEYSKFEEFGIDDTPTTSNVLSLNPFY